MAVDGLIDEAGSVEADPRWRDLGREHPDSRRASARSHPPTLQAELRDYQQEGFVWLSRLAHLEMGACLADDMGLGKTVQAIALLLEQAERGAALVVAPTSVCHNWESELDALLPPSRCSGWRRKQTVRPV